MSDNLIEACAVNYREGTKLILQDISLILKKGQIVSIVGPNGAGKTTLLKILLGLIKPTTGKVSTVPHLRIGYMPQRWQVDPLFPLTVKRFLQLGQADVSLERTLLEVGIKQQILANPLYTLSGGELQRVLLARALLRQPQLLVLDEPAQGVDLLGQGEFYDLIARIREQQGCAILLVSHDLNVVMAQTDIVVCLNQHVCCSGHPEKVSKDPAFTALFGHIAQNLAFYTHRHDHHHDVHGEVVDTQDHRHD
ncbi:ATP-binding cassette domain-containing protein [Candidatus Berkiella aquae]|uniref:ATP-binding cassette domain-containing protein n=1 Tax=Candidatus Berkiella aquae TaxID=295108 RepID=UPI0009467BB0